MWVKLRDKSLNPERDIKDKVVPLLIELWKL